MLGLIGAAAAGMLGEPFPTFLLLVAPAKIGRYLVLTAMTPGVA